MLLTSDITIDTQAIEEAAQNAVQVAKEAVPEDVSQKISLFQRYWEQLPEKALGLGIRIVLAILTLIIGIWVIKIIRKILKKSLERSKADIGVAQFLDSFAKTVMMILLIFMIATNFGVDAASIVAVLGSMGVAIGLALQGSLANIAGGVLILLMKPFKVGDFIREDSHKNEGTVTKIELFYTKLITVDKKVVVLPNGALANTSLINYSTLEYRRVDMEVGISYTADIKKAKEVATKAMLDHKLVVEFEPYSVYVKELADSAVVLGLYCHVKSSDFIPAREALLEQVKLAFDANGITIPFPQLDVHMS